MRGLRWIFMGLLMLVVGLASGCQTDRPKRTATVISPAPTVGDASQTEGATGEKTISMAPASTVSFADRHPLFTKPRQYWDTSGDNKIVKAAAATFIGVPAGFVGEVKQIFVGMPPEPKY
jgi:hypothetical protein